MIRFFPLLLPWTLSLLGAAARPAPDAHPPVAGQVTFLYFDDLERAAHFYGDVLGLEKTFELDWVRIYRVSGEASVGLVNATKGAHRPSAEKPVMVSLVVSPEDVDRWYSYLKAKGVDVGERPSSGAEGHVRAFSFKDPEGYSLEVFAWTSTSH